MIRDGCQSKNATGRPRERARGTRTRSIQLEPGPRRSLKPRPSPRDHHALLGQGEPWARQARPTPKPLGRGTFCSSFIFIPPAL